MRAAQRNAKIERAKSLKLRRNRGGKKLRETFGETWVWIKQRITPKHVLHRQRAAEQRAREDSLLRGK